MHLIRGFESPQVRHGMVGLAQLVRASGCGPEGRGFESHNSPHVVAGYDSSRRFFFQIPLGCYIASEFLKGLPFAALILGVILYIIMYRFTVGSAYEIFSLRCVPVYAFCIMIMSKLRDNM